MARAHSTSTTPGGEPDEAHTGHSSDSTAGPTAGPTADSKADARHETKADAKHDAKHDAKAEAKHDARTETKASGKGTKVEATVTSGLRKDGTPKRLSRIRYEAELLKLQGELVAVQEWVKATNQRLVVVFEGRDAAGKGSTIKRITEFLNPRVARIVALPVPTERQKTQWYFQKYVEHLPAAGEIVLFDRSWYNRAGVERVMGFCSIEEHRRFLHQAPMFERMLVEDGILLRKYWFSVSDEEQERRFRSRVEDPLRRWKFSPNDLLTRDRWVDFSKAKDEMFVHTDLPEAPWYVVEADIKRHARLNMISHLLSVLPYRHIDHPKIQLPPRPPAQDYERPPRELFHQIPDYAATLMVKETKGD
jgi:polyphosphate kinase 2